jgi:hypothetical protein
MPLRVKNIPHFRAISHWVNFTLNWSIQAGGTFCPGKIKSRGFWRLAGALGVEPRFSDSKSGVLPLDDTPKIGCLARTRTSIRWFRASNPTIRRQGNYDALSRGSFCRAPHIWRSQPRCASYSNRCGQPVPRSCLFQLDRCDENPNIPKNSQDTDCI